MNAETVHGAAVELVDHECLESIVDRVDPRDPSEPNLLPEHGNKISSVNQEYHGSNSGSLGSVPEVGAEGTDHAVERVETEHRNNQGNPEDEELAGVQLEVAHEVVNDGEKRNLQDRDGDIGYAAGNSVGSRAIKPKILLSAENGTSHERFCCLGHGLRAEVDHGEKKGAGACENGCTTIRQHVEERSVDESLAKSAGKPESEGHTVSPDDLELSHGAGHDLCWQTDCVRARLSEEAFLDLVLDRGDKLLRFNGKFFMALDLLHVLAVDGTIPEDALKVRGTGGYAVLVAGLDLALVDDRDGREEVGNIGTSRADESHILKVALGQFSRAVVHLVALVNKEDLVEEVVDVVSCLIEGCQDGLLLLVGECAERLGEIQSR